jgi:hypothetical protein
MIIRVEIAASELEIEPTVKRQRYIVIGKIKHQAAKMVLLIW